LGIEYIPQNNITQHNLYWPHYSPNNKHIQWEAISILDLVGHCERTASRLRK